MTFSGDSLKTQTVARALGLSVSTIKRWVDSGRSRRSGRWGSTASSRGRKPSAWPRNSGSIRGSRQGRRGRVGRAARLRRGELRPALSALEGGRGVPGEALIQSIYNSRVRRRGTGRPGDPACDDANRPFMDGGLLDIYQEHQASHIVASSLMELIERVSSERVRRDPLPWGPRLRVILMSSPACWASLPSARWAGRSGTWG